MMHTNGLLFCIFKNFLTKIKNAYTYRSFTRAPSGGQGGEGWMKLPLIMDRHVKVYPLLIINFFNLLVK